MPNQQTPNNRQAGQQSEEQLRQRQAGNQQNEREQSPNDKQASKRPNSER